jgi:2-amino-4-hydroxy-6-hydroxymethyldihydropteridine diphosphokinase
VRCASLLRWGWRLNAPGTGKPDPCADRPRRGLGRPSTRPTRLAYIGFGSNIKPIENLTCALKLLAEHVIVEQVAQTWESPAVGSRGPNFLNTAAAIRTPLPPKLLKSLVLLRVERELGRVRTANKNAPRTIDLDILVYEERVLDPKVWTEAFVAIPLAELLPDLQHPLTDESLAQVANRLATITPLTLRPEIPSGDFH